MQELLKQIKWQEVHSGSAYLYGTSLRFLEDSVIFTNERLASGKPLMTFLSKTHYQGNRCEPDLPVLIPNEKYVIESNISSEPLNRIFIQLNFFNRLGEKMSFEVLRDCKGEFLYPEEAYAYDVTVFSSGCSQMHFHDISIYHKRQHDKVNEDTPPANCYQENQLPEALEFVKAHIQVK